MKILLALCALVACTAALGQSSYVCTVEKTVAFKFDKQTKTWSNVSFAMKDEYVIRRPNPKDSPSEQKAAGSSSEASSLSRPASTTSPCPRTTCCARDGRRSDSAGKECAFVSAFLMGYFSDDLSGRMALEEGSNEPSLKIGRCRPGLVQRSGVPTGIRTPVTAVKGRCPRPLDDGD